MTRQQTATVLLLLAAVGALTGSVSAFVALGDPDYSGDAARAAQLWRAWGLAFFAGVFVVLARTSVPDLLWWLVIANKAGLAVTMGLVGSAGDAVVDAVLVAVVLTAYVLSRRPVAPAARAGQDVSADRGVPATR
jgi:hypothetical protein